MVYKSKKEKDQAIVQFVGDCITQKGMKKSDAVTAAMEEFHILSHATIYLAIRRSKMRHSKEQSKNVYNG